MAKNSGKIDPTLEKAVRDLLKKTLKDATATLTDKCKAIDRALKLEAIKAKLTDSGYGSGFGDAPEEDDQSGD